ncbi:dihydrodipicolinate synthase family protein [Stygiobacter electus]|jgi:4-hydroxy-2-oxoglutarate aldolase|uniref:Dihydrodipicolinate synthase family protein n=1 Tax=Stygiobacter electus TaxID=3032292 RepID=A0AAE3TCZ0_9BACT|nr:dihydrodipicolinate synthase family protein [Stygiobacter electus]MDF1611956.1 dihydrodipicolinate synthase family protein [Stygiobacter electus]
MKNLYGIFPPITTPFVNGVLSIEKLQHNISIWNKTKLSGYVVMGSNGEAVLLTKEEKLKLIEHTKLFSSSEKIIIAGTGSDSIKETIALTNSAANLGADFALVLTPSFYKSEMKHNNYIKYFSEVADKSKIPIIIYNVPKFTGVDIEVETVAELSKHENIVGIKNSTENSRQIIEFVSNTEQDFKVIVGTASMLFSGITSGAVGGILALANIAPNQCIQIHKLIDEKNYDEALKLQQKMIPANKAVTSKYGVAGLKYAMDLLGYFGGEPRIPLLPLNEKDKEQLKHILIQTEILR